MKNRDACINDLNLKNWKEYGDILTDSLWFIGGRDNSGAHNNAYHGNFIPQIPNQFMQRFTKKGDVVLDPFLGSGTTLIESKKLGRHGIGIELLPEVARIAEQNIGQESMHPEQVVSKVIVADNTSKRAREKVERCLNQIGADKLHMILLHPPYHDIIKFSDRREDLCNAGSVEEFTARFGDVISNFSGLLEKNRYLAVVIGDKYTNSAWVPLGFYLMQETLNRDKGLTLKSILIKNMTNNRAKLNQENLWRYRALVGGFYIFKHEYILVFKKTS
ncbi:MAG: DNA methyltransferase [Gammaproteobacteria bacterium]|nr:DNA methyltransferase [Gammaproteobacteria bacterium]